MLSGCVYRFEHGLVAELRGMKRELAIGGGESLIERVCLVWCIKCEYEVGVTEKMQNLLKNHEVV